MPKKKNKPPSTKSKPAEVGSIPPCPYCAHPELFKTPEDIPVDRTTALVFIKKKYWRKLVTRDRDGSSRSWRVKSLPTLIYKNNTAGNNYKKQWRFKIKGAKEFIKRFRDFNVEVIGLEVKGIPIMSSGPGFHRVGPGHHRVNDVMVPDETCLLYSACRITHAKSEIVIDAHAWPTHKLFFAILDYPLAPTKDSHLIIQEALEFFTVETRGRPKIIENDLIQAIGRLGRQANQMAVAKELGVTPQALRAWAKRSNLQNWKQVIERYSKAIYT
jgi:hypothetical protein